MPGPVSETAPSLVDRMRKLANSGHPKAEQLREHADALDAAAIAEDFNAKKLLGAWARARRLWCSITGEPLV